LRVATFRVAARHHLVEAGAEAGHLQLDVVLVGPEPGRGGEGAFAAEQRHGRRPGLLHGVLHRFEAAQAAVGQAPRGAVAGGDDGRVRGPAAGIDHDAVDDFQSGILRQFGVRDHADADQQQVGGVLAAIAGPHRGDAAILADQFRDHGVQHQVDAVAGVQVE
jgi:hypothetical protein